jgi:hypothetical protein
VQELTWLWATQQLNGETPKYMGKYKSAYMIEPFPGDQIEVMWKYLTKPECPNPRSLLQIDSYGCQVNAVAPDATAVPQRSSIMKLQFQAYWREPSEAASNLVWIREFYKEMYGPNGPTPGPVMDGCYVNYPDVDLHNWQYLYYRRTIQRCRRPRSAGIRTTYSTTRSRSSCRGSSRVSAPRRPLGLPLSFREMSE